MTDPTTQDAPDWRALLVRYMAIVLARESWSYLREEDWPAEEWPLLDRVHGEAMKLSDGIESW